MAPHIRMTGRNQYKIEDLEEADPMHEGFETAHPDATTVRTLYVASASVQSSACYAELAVAARES